MSHFNSDLKEEEFASRVERAKKQRFSISSFSTHDLPFTDYRVIGESQIPYRVEIRSLQEKINTCSCPDYHVNTLGSCKHIEGVLNFILKKGKRKFAQAAKEGSSRVEIFFDLSISRPTLLIPSPQERVKEALTLISPYLSANNTLLEPIAGLEAIKRALQAASTKVTNQVRLSSYLLKIVKEERMDCQRQEDKQAFLADVESGKRSLQVLPTPLFSYQQEGMLHLAFKGRAILADEMGLGKTIQAIAACELLRTLGRVKSILIVTPASLKGEWEEQIAQFSSLTSVVVKGSRSERLTCYKKSVFFYLVNYEQVRSDYDEIQTLLEPDVMILDEAQRIKNWETKTAWSVKRLSTPYAFVLTGTPIENRIEELYSIMQVVNPKLLGPLFRFRETYYDFDEKGKVVGCRNLQKLQHVLKPVLLRRRKGEIEEQLPERVIHHYFVKMGTEQIAHYEGYSSQVARLVHILKKRPFTLEESQKMQRLLACMRMVADTPYILDPNCKECPKLEELEEVLKELLNGEDDRKIIVFSEWKRMLDLVQSLIERLQLPFAYHTGSVSQEKRRQEIRRFKEDPECRLFLSTDSGSTGLNLQVASVVINIDLPWNPAKLEQRIARAWRKNQKRTVQVVNFVSEGTIEHRMLGMLEGKQAIASAVLDGVALGADMPRSTSRSQLIERLEQLTEGVQSKEAISPAKKEDPWHSLKEDMLARFSNRIHLVEKHQGHLLLVVDKNDDRIAQTAKEISPLPIEILDLETYSALQKLAAAGIIHFNIEDREVLHASSMAKKAPSPTQIDRAVSIHRVAERSVKMAILLMSGGFVTEALPPAREALAKGMDALRILEKKADATILALKEQEQTPKDPSAFVEAVSNWLKDLSGLLTEFALGVVTATP